MLSKEKVIEEIKSFVKLLVPVPEKRDRKLLSICLKLSIFLNLYALPLRFFIEWEALYLLLGLFSVLLVPFILKKEGVLDEETCGKN